MQGLKIINKKIYINLKFLELQNLRLNFYRFYLKNFLNYKLKIVLRIKSSLKFWGFRFFIYGLITQFFLFHNVEISIPTAHSTSLRLKKKRRI